ncbi:MULTISPECIES: pro-sigmaK processing inhibitor BofA family protein [unclassified Paenibacillus]|uniref:pro-sigmaK processing inhibitor BofA family protein n=1 Tax=unclassified Paenibacillus TaxID=185978 RepID=UPI001C128596|nr:MULTISPECIES: pro-sigmaK processing inhibitor BofA family protein [unclassified Paenibacillus]MBU5444482.1 pro-sigmaK processing inhibitor BofA family protein [Paenibacillus sp. MSJ-34]CAH0122722.1 hypothetical protein PAE9249_05311 [Paenibacillus sp. CECT 9249]
MKLFLSGVLVVSLLLLLYTVVKQRLSLRWLKALAINVILAALMIYVVNFSGLFSDLYIPLNPATMGTAALLGVPGVLLMICIKLTLF